MRATKTMLALPLMLLAATAAQACQLICQKTNTLFDGNLGGLTGADAKCVTEFGTGWKFPRSISLVLNVSTAGSSSATANTLDKFTRDGISTNYAYAWLAPSRGNASTMQNCSNWSSNSSSIYSLTASNSGSAYIGNASCDTQLPIICCNM